MRTALLFGHVLLRGHAKRAFDDDDDGVSQFL